MFPRHGGRCQGRPPRGGRERPAARRVESREISRFGRALGGRKKTGRGDSPGRPAPAAPPGARGHRSGGYCRVPPRRGVCHGRPTAAPDAFRLPTERTPGSPPHVLDNTTAAPLTGGPRHPNGGGAELRPRSPAAPNGRTRHDLLPASPGSESRAGVGALAYCHNGKSLFRPHHGSCPNPWVPGLFPTARGKRQHLPSGKGDCRPPRPDIPRETPGKKRLPHGSSRPAYPTYFIPLSGGCGKDSTH
jgi:hypothetical protein